jgi:hypothetical protein
MILELYPNVITKENNKELMDFEDKYLKFLLPNFNIITKAASSFGFKHTEVQRHKMKDIYSDARREKIGSLNRGNKFSEETIEKMRAKALNRPPMSKAKEKEKDKDKDKDKEKEIKQKCIVNTKPVILYNLNIFYCLW